MWELYADTDIVRLLQPDINEKMRAILIDWLVEVHLKFKVSCGHRSFRHTSHACLPADHHVFVCQPRRDAAAWAVCCLPGCCVHGKSWISCWFLALSESAALGDVLQLMPESLFLTINLIDRYLAVRPVTRKNLQLVGYTAECLLSTSHAGSCNESVEHAVSWSGCIGLSVVMSSWLEHIQPAARLIVYWLQVGVTAMLVAAKYEEIWAPEVRDFVYISDKAYTRKQILDTEKDMLQALGYNLSLPTSYQFLARLLKAANVHYEKNLALFVAYCAELCLVDYSILRHSYSELAAAIMYVAMKAFNKQDPYPYNLMRHAAYDKESVLHISKEVVKLVQNAHSSNLQAVVKKYSTVKFCEASSVPPPLDILDE